MFYREKIVYGHALSHDEFEEGMMKAFILDEEQRKNIALRRKELPEVKN